MSTYLKRFDEETEYIEYKDTGIVTPNVSLVRGDELVHYNENWSKKPLTFKILSSGTIKWETVPSSNVSFVPTPIRYSINRNDWATLSPDGEINVSFMDIVRFKNDADKYSWAYNSAYHHFTGTATFEIMGNVMSLFVSSNFCDTSFWDEIAPSWAAASLFRDSNVVSVKNLFLPRPRIGSYYRMFSGCSSLIDTPELPVNVYNECFGYMFANCTSLKETAVFPATNPTYDNVYGGMYSNCGSLTYAHDLPGTTVGRIAYQYMFQNCRSLTRAPVIYATSLGQQSAQRMFQNCSKIDHIECHATTFGENATDLWTSGVASTGTFIKASGAEWDTGTSGIPENWTVEEITSTSSLKAPKRNQPVEEDTYPESWYEQRQREFEAELNDV